MKTETITLSQVRTDANMQIRAAIDEATVTQYAELMTENITMPPIVVFGDGNQYILADGFHRLLAAARNDFLTIEAEIYPGTRADALRYALSANSTHGLRRTNADKRRSVELALAEWPKLSDRELSRVCAVSVNFVGDVRRQLSSDDSCEPSKRIGADGKERKLPTRKPAPAPEPEPEVAPEPEPDHIESPEASPTPSQRDLSADWEHAVGKTPARQFFAAQAEDVFQACLDDGSKEQREACKLVCEVWARKFRKVID